MFRIYFWKTSEHLECKNVRKWAIILIFGEPVVIYVDFSYKTEFLFSWNVQ